MDKIFSDIKNSVGSAVKKSGELLEITKMKVAIGDTKNEINVKLTELGRKAYEAQKNGSISDADGLVYEIDELYEILKSQEAKLASLKKQKVCAACGTLCEIEAAYCSKCGEKFPERPAEEQEEDAAPEDDEAEVVETVLTAEE